MSSILVPRWREDLILFLTLLAAVAWFHHEAPGWNVNSRLALTRALTEYGTLRVDQVLQGDPEMETEDLARFQGHLYSDKTPGVSFLAVPAAYAVQAWESVDGPVNTAQRRYWITFGSCGLAFAAFGVLLRRLISALLQDGGMPCNGPPQTIPVLCAVAAGVATPAFYYGSLFMSYAPMLALLTGAALLILKAIPLPQPQDENSLLPPFRWGLLFIAGILCGLALLMEYVAGLALGALGLYAWGRVLVGGGHRWILRFIAVPLLLIGGTILGWLPFAFYALSAFGAITLPYTYHAHDMFRAYMARGFMGINTPNPLVAWLVTFHPYRGIFVQAPWLAVGLFWSIGLLARWLMVGTKQPVAESPAPVSPATSGLPPGFILWTLSTIAAFAGYVTFNAGYYMWWGGWSFAPRHLVPAIPFLVGCAAFAAMFGGRLCRGLLMGGVAWAVLIQATVMATDPQTRDIGRAGGTSLPRLLEPRIDAIPPWPWTRQVLPRIQARATSYALSADGLRGWAGLVPWAGLIGLGTWLATGRSGSRMPRRVDP